MRQLIDAVSYIHDQNIAHRDIKLENILLTKSGVVKLIDFGFAISSNGPLKTFCGTPTYMAPELVRRAEYFGPSVDKWALGVLIYRMVSGWYPFRGIFLESKTKSAQKDRELYRKINLGIYDQKVLPTAELKDVVSK